MEWWADDHTAPNVGVILGPTYGVPGRPVFDVEADNAEGIAILKTLGLDRFETPTYESGKSPHRLFQHEDGLPPTNVFTWKGVEVRLGGDGGQEQSVMPPSIHHTGKMYRWVDGFSLDDVEIAPVPPVLKEWILEAYDLYSRCGSDEGAGGAKGRGRALLRRQHYETAAERHDALMAFAGLLSRAVHLGDEDDEHLFLRALRAVNQTQCVPPKPDDEVIDCWRYALKYRALDTASAKLCEGIAIKGSGGGQQFVPDGLTLTIVKSDPPSYRLFCEAWKKFNGTGVANLSAEDFMSAKKAAVALAAQVGGLRLDRWPGIGRVFGTAGPVARRRSGARARTRSSACAPCSSMRPSQPAVSRKSSIRRGIGCAGSRTICTRPSRGALAITAATTSGPSATTTSCSTVARSGCLPARATTPRSYGSPGIRSGPRSRRLIASRPTRAGG